MAGRLAGAGLAYCSGHRGGASPLRVVEFYPEQVLGVRQRKGVDQPPQISAPLYRHRGGIGGVCMGSIGTVWGRPDGGEDLLRRPALSHVMEDTEKQGLSGKEKRRKESCRMRKSETAGLYHISSHLRSI